ncbi:MAG: electron-transfer flavoprotein:ubiquinone oxidoreductase [Gemmatimonadota bacterium]
MGSRLSAIPASFRPSLAPDEFIAEPAAGPDERIDVGVLFVGAGPAGLAGAIRLAQLLEDAPEVRERLGETPIAVAEKGKYPGAHLVSGAVVNPVAFRKLFPDVPDGELPLRSRVTRESVYLLTASRAIPLPTPPTMRNHGNVTASVSEIARWLGERAEAAAVMLLNETAAQKLLVHDGAVCGVLTGDKGLGRDGAPMANHEPGVEMHAQATVLAEGVTGHLSQTLVEHFAIRGPNPQVYSLGVKEVWEVPQPLDRVIHTLGWPLRGGRKWREFGGTWLYPLGQHQVSLGIVVGLDYADASLSAHDLLQEFKLHPLVRGVLEGGTRHERGWGAKTIPEGGYYALPQRLAVPGAVLVGDAAGFVNVPALKGIHYAMWSGILAAEAIFAALKAGKDLRAAGALDGYDSAVRASFIARDLYRMRNMRQAFGAGFVAGGALAGMMTATAGLFPGWRFGATEDAEHGVARSGRTYAKPDGKLTFDKLQSVYDSGNRTRDTQPNHIRVETDVPEEVAEAWIRMCPAEVYEWATDASGKKVLVVNATNCVQCGAITAKGGRLTPPEGGSGPEYTVT